MINNNGALPFKWLACATKRLMHRRVARRRIRIPLWQSRTVHYTSTAQLRQSRRGRAPWICLCARSNVGWWVVANSANAGAPRHRVHSTALRGAALDQCIALRGAALVQCSGLACTHTSSVALSCRFSARHSPARMAAESALAMATEGSGTSLARHPPSVAGVHTRSSRVAKRVDDPSLWAARRIPPTQLPIATNRNGSANAGGSFAPSAADAPQISSATTALIFAVSRQRDARWCCGVAVTAA